MDLAPPGRAAAAATCGVAARADHPIPVCVGEFGPVDLDLHPHAGARPAAAAATAVADFFFRLANCGSGWSRGWTSGRRGERPRPMGSRRDRRAVAHSGWGPVNRLLHSYARASPATALLAELRGWGSSPTATRLATARTRLPVNRLLHSYARASPATALLAELRGWGSSPTATRLATARTRLRCELALDFPLLDSTGERAPSGAANFLFAKSAGRRRWPRPRRSYWSSRRIGGLCFATRRRPTALTQLP